MISASAGTTTPRPASSAWAIPTIDQLRAELRAAEGKAAAAQAEAMASAPVCEGYERKNILFQKCKHCRRREVDCNRSREAHERRLLCDKKVSAELTKMEILSAAVSLSQFIAERPGFVRVVGARLLQYYDVNTAD